MPAKDKAAKAGKAARAAQSNPYVQRLIEDDKLRDNLRSAYDSARGAYGRMNHGKNPTRALMEDKKLQKQLRQAAQSLNDAGTALRNAPKRGRSRRGLGTLVVIGLVGAAAALVLNEGLRSKLLDMLFGSEEEFDYTSTTAPPTAAPAATEPAAAS